MTQDKCLLNLERAIFNWYYGGEDASPLHIFNAIHDGLENDIQLYVPIEIPEKIQQMIGDPEKVKAGDVFTVQEDVKIQFRHLLINENGEYIIPLFTREEELGEGEATSVMHQPFAALIGAIESWPKCAGFVINPWNKRFILPREMLDMIMSYKRRSHLSIVKGSVVDMHVGAIVNAANRTLLGGGGVDGAIHQAAGKELGEKCRKLNGCRTGEAKITGAYGISYADYIIHTVGPVYSGQEEDAQLLAACYRNSLDLAYIHGCSSIAFPGISTGIYGYPLAQAANVALLTVVRWFEAHKDIVMDVYFCCFKDEEYDTYMGLIRQTKT